MNKLIFVVSLIVLVFSNLASADQKTSYGLLNQGDWNVGGNFTWTNTENRSAATNGNVINLSTHDEY